MTFEAEFQDRLVDLLGVVSGRFRFNGYLIKDVKRDDSIDGRRVDVAVYLDDGSPLLFIETKRKAGLRSPGRFEPLDPKVVGQAISYVYLYNRKTGKMVPYFGVANPSNIVVFRSPEDLERYIRVDAVEKREYSRVIRQGRYSELLEYIVIQEGQAFKKPFRWDEDFIIRILETLARDLSGVETTRVELTDTLLKMFRNFVDEISGMIEPLIKYRMEADQNFIRELERLSGSVEELPTLASLSKMTAYILMNKLVFYKILERKYSLPHLSNLPSDSISKFRERLQEYFERAVEKTGDFEPVFITGLYDSMPYPDNPEFMDKINDFIDFLERVDLDVVSDIIGYIYEDLIEPRERHQLGQFYTPPAICELITKWCIRSGDDKVLDPGTGSGGFITQAYRILALKKLGYDTPPIPGKVHEKILDQLYAIDINPFATHLTAIALSMKNVRSPSTNINVIVEDFFNILPRQTVLAPFIIKTRYGEIQRKIVIPEVDAVVGNPPYTRWDEIPSNVRDSIRKRCSEEIKKYNLLPSGGIRAAQNPGIYIFWIMHATKFLREGGRLGMIISNLWLQADYGIPFGKFLKDNYRIHAIIDFSQRLFTIPTISTLVILAEKCGDKEKRDNNEVVFLYVNKRFEVDDLLNIIKSRKPIEGVTVKVIKQSDLPDDMKWMTIFKEIDVWENEKLVKAEVYFNISRGSVKWFMEKLAGSGADPFFYLTPDRIEDFQIPNEYVYPALVSATHAKYFTYKECDWKAVKQRGGKCYMFICSKPRNELPKPVKNYIRWGETVCRVSIQRGGGKICSETAASKSRARARGYHGWYDLGEVRIITFFAVRQARHKTRFVKCEFPVAMYDGLITFTPKEDIEFSDDELKALLAYLNSSFTQYYIETHGRYISKGPIALEVKHAKKMPILDVKRLDKEKVELLSRKFDELEAEARKVGGASEKRKLEKLKPKIYEIDWIIGDILGLSEETVKAIQETVEMLIDRRVKGSRSVNPNVVKQTRRRRRRPTAKPLDEFL